MAEGSGLEIALDFLVSGQLCAQVDTQDSVHRIHVSPPASPQLTGNTPGSCIQGPSSASQESMYPVLYGGYRRLDVQPQGVLMPRLWSPLQS